MVLSILDGAVTVDGQLDRGPGPAAVGLLAGDDLGGDKVGEVGEAILDAGVGELACRRPRAPCRRAEMRRGRTARLDVADARVESPAPKASTNSSRSKTMLTAGPAAITRPLPDRLVA